MKGDLQSIELLGEEGINWFDLLEAVERFGELPKLEVTYCIIILDYSFRIYEGALSGKLPLCSTGYQSCK